MQLKSEVALPALAHSVKWPGLTGLLWSLLCKKISLCNHKNTPQTQPGQSRQSRAHDKQRSASSSLLKLLSLVSALQKNISL